MEHGGERGRPFLVRKIGLPDHVYVLGSLENGHRVHYKGEEVAVSLGSGAVEVEEVLVLGVEYGEQEAEDPDGVVGGSGDEVGDGGGRGGRGERGGGGEEEAVSREEVGV